MIILHVVGSHNKLEILFHEQYHQSPDTFPSGIPYLAIPRWRKAIRGLTRKTQQCKVIHRHMNVILWQGNGIPQHYSYFTAQEKLSVDSDW